MKVYMVEADSGDVEKITDQWVFRRAVVVAINEEAAVQCVLKGLRGAEVFTGNMDEGMYARPQDTGYFDSGTCTVTLIGNESRSVDKNRRRTRILVWELCAPTEAEDTDLTA